MEKPIFILCHPKSGSTLLRLILNAHPTIACPPETHLLVLGVALKQTLSITEKSAYEQATLDEFNDAITERIRHQLMDIMNEYTMRHGKQVWCDKSVTTMGDLPFLKKLFPEARFIVLYRHCMDFIHSAIEVSRHGWKEIGVEIKDPENIIDSITDFWLEQTAMLQDFAQENPASTLELKYESLLLEPDASLKHLFDFLGLSIPENFIESIFSSNHQHGTGDPKARFFKKLETSNIGKGRFIPFEKLSNYSVRRMNTTLKALDYEPVEESWNQLPLPETSRIDTSSSPGSLHIQQQLDNIFEAAIPQGIAALCQNEAMEPRRIKLIVVDCSDRSYLLDFGSGTCTKTHLTEKADATLSFKWETFREILEGRLNPGQAVSLGKIVLTGDPDSAGLVPRIFDYI